MSVLRHVRNQDPMTELQSKSWVLGRLTSSVGRYLPLEACAKFVYSYRLPVASDVIYVISLNAATRSS